MTEDIWSQTIGTEGLEELAAYLSNKPRDMNEADTRHQILDILVHDLLAWPRNRVGVETKVNSGYVDYVLRRHNGEPALLIEAKREGKYFELPIAKKEENWSYIGLDKLMSDINVKSAINQVRSYSLDIGSEYAAISNGHEWVIFKTFDKGKKWDSLHAFVVRSISFFQEEYTKSYNSLSFTAINDNFSLVSLLTSSAVKDRAIYYPKDGIAAYSHQITANRLAGALRPIVTRYFGVISDEDTDFMNKCYVAEREYRPAFASMRDLLEDSISPYFRSYGVKQLQETGKGGQLGGRITKNIRLSRKGEVLVLFGGKGAGKSTFLKRLLHHNPPKWLRENSIIALIDLLKIPESTGLIRDAIWDGLVNSLDPEGLLASDRATLLRDIFEDRFDLAGKQQLSGLAKTSEA